MTAPNFAGVLAAHEPLGFSCACGWRDETATYATAHRAHVAAVLDAEVSAWLGSEAAALRNYDGAVMTNERWGEGFLAGIDYAADQLAALAQGGGGS